MTTTLPVHPPSASSAPSRETPPKVLFLDIDGVLNTIASLAEGVHLLPEKVLLVQDICLATGAHVVISSAWRAMFDENTLRSILFRLGLRKATWDGYVCEDRGKRRPHEIADYVQNHGITDYVILDDDDWDWYPDQAQRWIHTPVEIGLCRYHVCKAIEILGRCAPAGDETFNGSAAELLRAKNAKDAEEVLQGRT